jgi:antitoxin component of MazEF toxin-antitoxin module
MKKNRIKNLTMENEKIAFQRVRSVGGSLVVSIPRKLARQRHIKKDALLQFTLFDNWIAVEPIDETNNGDAWR